MREGGKRGWRERGEEGGKQKEGWEEGRQSVNMFIRRKIHLGVFVRGIANLACID